MFTALVLCPLLLNCAGVRAQGATEPGEGTDVVDAAELSQAVRDGASQISIESSITGILGEQPADTSVQELTRYDTFPEMPERCLNDPEECLENDQYVKMTVPTVITSPKNALVDFGFQRRRIILTQDITFQDITLQGIASDYSPYIFFFLFYNNANLVCNNCVVEHACAGTDYSFFLESMRLAELSQAEWQVSEDLQSLSGSFVMELAQDITQGTTSTQVFKNCTLRCNPNALPEQLSEGLSYRGVQSTTMNGYTCQSWLSNTPNFHTRNPATFPEAGLAVNYCRNPDNELGVWCYTIDGPRWERCKVPFCDSVANPSPPPSSASQSNGSRNGIIAGVASALGVVLLLLALMVWRLCRHRQLAATQNTSETLASNGTAPRTGLPISHSRGLEAEKERSRKGADEIPEANPPKDTVVGLPHLVKVLDDRKLPDGQKGVNGEDSGAGGGMAAENNTAVQGREGGPRSNIKTTDEFKDVDKDKDDSAHGRMVALQECLSAGGAHLSRGAASTETTTHTVPASSGSARDAAPMGHYDHVEHEIPVYLHPSSKMAHAVTARDASERECQADATVLAAVPRALHGVATRDSVSNYNTQREPLPELPEDATVQERKEHLEEQLDRLANRVVGDSLLVLPGAQNRMEGGQAVVQIVEDVQTRQKQAMKFFLSYGAFKQERDLYEDSAQPLAMFLPQLSRIAEGDIACFRDAQGGALAPCIVMEKGEALDVWIKNSGDHIDMFTGLQVLSHIAERLRDLHAAGYVHRDLKPGNIMWLPRKKRWTLIDFGCAARTGTHAPTGFSLHYAAPEALQAYVAGAGGVQAEEALDAWSLGVLAIELFTAVPVFSYLTPKEETIDMILGRNKAPWEDPETSKKLLRPLGIFECAVLGLLHRDAAQRSTIQAFLEATRRALINPSITATSNTHM